MAKTEVYRSGGAVAISIAGFAVLAYLIYLLSKQLPTLISQLTGDKTVKDVVESSTTTDGTTVIDEENTFEAEAKTIADGQYNAMQGKGTYEQSLYSGVSNLNGAQLQLVYQAFGKRDGKTLFEWYADELCDNFFCGYWYQDTVPNCTTWSDNCTELEFMRAIWQKSGLPLTF